jgi:pseudaminic acid cytidylyltransferase
MALCIIPARGGSKRIPHKNSRMFHGKPMICWSIEAAIQSGVFEHIIVSTDSEDIARIAQESGASVPFRRPAQLANDYATTVDVMNHAIVWFQNHYPKSSVETAAVCCLYATSPLLVADDIKQGYQRLAGYDFVVPVTTFAHPVQRAVKINGNRSLSMFDSEKYQTRSQDLEEAWHDCGQFYWGTADAWRSGKSPYDMCACPLPIPRWRVQDIDTEEDWVRAEAMFSMINTV